MPNAPTAGMKPLPKLIFALTAVASFSVAYPAKANLITNPGFETGNLTGWTPSGGFPTTVTGTLNGISPHSGSFQARIPTTGLATNLAQSVTTTPGATYMIDFFAAATNGN